MANRRRRYLLLADEDLISLVKAADPEAFAVLYDRHGRTAYSLAYRMMGEKQGAQDLVQEAFIRVWRSAGSYRPERGSVRTWLLSIVHYRGVDLLRSSASRRRIQARVEAFEQGLQPSEAFTETQRSSQQEDVRAALRRLPPEQLKILELAYFSGYTQAEIAELLSLPLGTVKSRLRLGLKKIKNYFDSREATESG